MRFFHNLYLGQGVPDVKKIKRQLLNRSIFVKAYVITLSLGADQLEMYDAKVLRQSYYRNTPLTVVGIASDYEEALQLIMQITKDALKQGYEGRLKQFLLDMETE